MKLGIVAAIAVALFACEPVAAADLGVKDNASDTYASVFNWTGVTVDARVGNAVKQHSLKASEAPSEENNMDGTAYIDALSNSDVFGGFGLTYRYQVANAVFGAKATYDFGGSRIAIDTDKDEANAAKINDGSSIGLMGQVGYAFGRTLFHGDGGVSFEKTKYTGMSDAGFKKHHDSIIVGGGISYAFTDHVIGDLSAFHGIEDGVKLASDGTEKDATSSDSIVASLSYKF